MIKKSKVLSLLTVLFVYLLAFTGGYFSSLWIQNSIYVQFFFADVVATIIVWISSLILKNTSVYDPYWSLTPWVIATFFLIRFPSANIYSWIIYIVFSLWSWRLSINWIITFDNLLWEDWRYRHYRENSAPWLFHIINFTGLQMIPTILVYGGTVPLLYLIVNGANPLGLIGAGVTLLGIFLEFFADHQMHSFLKTTVEKKVCKKGLWKFSRHPNYLGENLVWIGVFLSLLLSYFSLWYLGFGFILILLLFEFISIPLMEKRQISRRSDYLEYKRVTPRLFMIPKFKKKNS